MKKIGEKREKRGVRERRERVRDWNLKRLINYI